MKHRGNYNGKKICTNMSVITTWTSRLNNLQEIEETEEFIKWQPGISPKTSRMRETLVFFNKWNLRRKEIDSVLGDFSINHNVWILFEFWFISRH